VFAFEPQPRIFQLLATNCVLNQALNARLFHAACGSTPGKIEISEIGYEQEINYGALELELLARAAAAPSAPARREVPLVRLDDCFDRDALKLIKIDVEGMEREVLEGAGRIVSAFRPVLYVENEHPNKSPALIQTLWDMGYEAWWHHTACFNPANYRGRADNLFGNASCLNMLCVPRERAGAIDGLAKVTDREAHPRRAA
jgi:FkbM family methyltransferase